MKVQLLSFVIVFTWFTKVAFAGWHDRKAEGWAWHEEVRSRLKKESEKEKEISKPAESSKEQLDEARKVLEEKISAAMLNPTNENVLAYMEEQKKWVNRAAEFSDIWTRLLLGNPLLDQTVVGRPVSQYGLQLHSTHELQKREKLIASLVESHGLIFFYEGESPISLYVAEIVERFSEKYDWAVSYVSGDGVSIEKYADSKLDKGFLEK